MRRLHAKRLPCLHAALHSPDAAWLNFEAYALVQQQIAEMSCMQGDTLEPELQQLQERLADAATAYRLETSAQWHLPASLATKLLEAITMTFELACTALTSEHSSLLAAEEDVQRVLNHRHTLQASSQGCCRCVLLSIRLTGLL